MNFEKYQEVSTSTMIYRDSIREMSVMKKEGSLNLAYCVLGLTGEAGEIAEKVKKLIRDKDGEMTQEFVDDMKKELGDVLWYITAIADEFNLQLEDIAQVNVDKLTSRQKRGKLKGSGDNR